jgi:hypothetical protein
VGFTASTLAQRAELAKTQDGFCPACGFALPDDLSDTEVDHIIPRVRGGPDRAWNRRLVHFKCNRSKRFKLTDEALALAAERGVILCEPKPRSEYRRSAGQSASLPADWPYREVAPLYPRKCSWCGAQVVASTDDPDVLIGCPACDRLYDGSPPLSAVLASAPPR